MITSRWSPDGSNQVWVTQIDHNQYISQMNTLIHHWDWLNDQTTLPSHLFQRKHIRIRQTTHKQFCDWGWALQAYIATWINHIETHIQRPFTFTSDWAWGSLQKLKEAKGSLKKPWKPKGSLKSGPTGLDLHPSNRSCCLQLSCWQTSNQWCLP